MEEMHHCLPVVANPHAPAHGQRQQLLAPQHGARELDAPFERRLCHGLLICGVEHCDQQVDHEQHGEKKKEPFEDHEREA